MICPKCYRANNDSMSTCVNCGTDMTTAFPAAPAPLEWDKESLKAVAVAQKRLIWVILLSLVASFIPYATIISGIIGIFFVFRLAKATRHEAPWIFIVLGFIPVVCLFALVRLNSRATKILQSKGIRVGLMGAKIRGAEDLTNSES